MAKENKPQLLVDTNTIIRLLTGEPLAQAQKALALFQSAEAGQVDLMLTESVLLETVQVLSSKKLYRLSHPVIVQKLMPILANTRYNWISHTTLFETLELFETSNLDYTDCLLIARAHELNIGIETFDEDLLKHA